MIKTMLFVIVVVLLSVFLVGCVSPADKARLIVLEEKVQEYEEKAADIAAKVNDGTLTFAESKTLYDGIRTDTKLVADEIKLLQAKGYSSLEIILAIIERLAIVGASYGAVYLSRGSIHSRRGEAPI